MRRWWLRLFLMVLLICCASYSKAQNTSLTGTLTAPGGALFNGYLWLSLAQPATVLGTCSGGPVYVLPNIFLSIQVINGAMVGSPKVWGADCLDPTGVPYNVKIVDMNNNVLVTDQWLIQGSSFNVGTATSALYSNTVTIPYVSQVTGPTGVSTGALTFTGPGVTQLGNTYTFSGSGSGTANPAPQYQLPYYSASGTANTLSGSPYLTTDASNNMHISNTLYVGGSLPAAYFNFKNLGTITSTWTFDYTSQLTAINSLAPIPINDLAEVSADSVIMNNTGSLANPAAASMPTCTGTGYADIYDTSVHGWLCNEITAATIPNALTFNISGGAAPGSSYNGSSTLQIDYHSVGAASGTSTGVGLTATSNVLSSNAEFVLNYTPKVGSTLGGFAKIVKASTVDNIEGSAELLSCTTNPTVTLYECGTSSTCATPTAIGTVTVTGAVQVFDGTISSASITAGDYVAWEITAGSCTTLDANITAMVHSN